VVTSQLEGATSELQVTYAADDPSFRAAVAGLPALRQLLRSLKDSVVAAQPAAPGALQSEFQDCVRAIDAADRRAASALTSSGGGQLGFVRALLPPELGDDDAEDRLGAVDRACAGTLNSALGDKDIAARSTALAAPARDLRDRFNAVDQPAAKRKAESELAVAKRTLKVIVEEMNLWSVSPLLMFDAVHMNVGGTRYGIGAGLRLALADSVDFSIGYMANRQRRPNEPAGAFLMSLQIKDIF